MAAVSKRASTIAEVRRLCRPGPLSGPDLDAFFVETDAGRDPRQSTRERLQMALDVCENVHVLLYGHRGCGKSTELNKFLSERQELLPVKFSIRDEMTPSHVLAEDLILVITDRVLRAAREQRLDVDEDTLKGVHDYFAEKEEKAVKERRGSIQAGVGVDTKRTYLGKLIGLFTKFSGEIRLDSHSQETTVAYLRKRPADLLAQANTVLEAVRDALPKGRRMLVVAEDMDKLDLKRARDIYVNNVNILAGLATSVIYTVPIFLFYSPDVNAFRHHFDDVIHIPMIRVAEPPNGRGEGFNKVREAVLARLGDDLITPDALDLLVEKTGGVLRHVFEALYTVGTITDLRPPMTRDDVRYGLDVLKSECWQQIALPSESAPDGPKAVTELYDRLAECARRQLKGEKSMPASDAINQILLLTCALVEYNGERWFGVHPLIIENLYASGRLP